MNTKEILSTLQRAFGSEFEEHEKCKCCTDCYSHCEHGSYAVGCNLQYVLDSFRDHSDIDRELTPEEKKLIWDMYESHFMMEFPDNGDYRYEPETNQ